jgi:hypothetical protein
MVASKLGFKGTSRAMANDLLLPPGGAGVVVARLKGPCLVLVIE